MWQLPFHVFQLHSTPAPLTVEADTVSATNRNALRSMSENASSWFIRQRVHPWFSENFRPLAALHRSWDTEYYRAMTTTQLTRNRPIDAPMQSTQTLSSWILTLTAVHHV